MRVWLQDAVAAAVTLTSPSVVIGAVYSKSTFMRVCYRTFLQPRGEGARGFYICPGEGDVVNEDIEGRRRKKGKGASIGMGQEKVGG